MSPITQTIFAAAASLPLMYAFATWLVADRFARPPGGRADVAPPPDAMGIENVAFCSRGDGVPLAGWYAAARNPRGAVVVVHGRGASKANALNRHAMPLVERLVDDGLSVLMIDLRGHGNSGPGRVTYGCNERLDVLGAVDWLVDRGHTAGTVGVLGVSMGGCAAIAAAADEPGIGAVVSDSAFADFDAVLRHNFPRVMRTRLALGLLPGALWFFERLTGVALQRFRPDQIARGLRGRALLLIHSAEDRFVQAEHTRAIGAASGAEVWISHSRGHVASYATFPAEYTERVAGFFGIHLHAEPAAKREWPEAPNPVGLATIGVGRS
ncbi:MAG: alpha/beta fold hydrolase [Burkholderiaceae bacterium]|nr:MAG: alpha/beta fold hydrolase [Burkholderiaceae bacterium]